MVAFPVTAFLVVHTRPEGTEHVAYQGSLHVKSDYFNDTLLDKDSQNYQEKKEKYEDMVSSAFTSSDKILNLNLGSHIDDILSTNQR